MRSVMTFQTTDFSVGLTTHEGKTMDETKQLRPAIFWDRDGTLIEDRGHLARARRSGVFAGHDQRATPAPGRIPVLHRDKPAWRR